MCLNIGRSGRAGGLDEQASGSRCHGQPQGITFYHKGKLPPVAEAVHTLTIEKRLWVDDLAGLLGLVEIGAVELHAWNATIDDIEHPDMLVFDLDPGEGVAWEFVIETALRLRRTLKDESLARGRS